MMDAKTEMAAKTTCSDWQGGGWYTVAYYDQTEQPAAHWYDFESDLAEEIGWAHEQCRTVDYVDCEYMGDGILPEPCESLDPHEGVAIDDASDDVWEVWSLCGAIKSNGTDKDISEMHDALWDYDNGSPEIEKLLKRLNKIYDSIE